MKRTGLGFAFLACLAWAALVLSSRGILVGAEGPIAGKKAGDQQTLNCTFFTGLSTVTISYWYDSQAMMGRVICPRVKDFR